MMELRGLSQKAFAAIMEVAEGTVINWRRGQLPKSSDLHKMARFFGRSMEWILTGEEGLVAAVNEDAATYDASSKRTGDSGHPLMSDVIDQGLQAMAESRATLVENGLRDTLRVIDGLREMVTQILETSDRLAKIPPKKSP